MCEQPQARSCGQVAGGVQASERGPRPAARGVRAGRRDRIGSTFTMSTCTGDGRAATLVWRGAPTRAHAIQCCVHLSMRRRKHSCACTACVCVCVRAHARAYLHIFARSLPRTYAHKSARARTHTHTHKRARTHTHIRRLYLEDEKANGRRKVYNIATCLKEPKFLDFFFKQLRVLLFACSVCARVYVCAWRSRASVCVCARTHLQTQARTHTHT